MPIYEYRCRECGEVIEVIQKFGDRARRKCRTCSGRLEKLVSRAAFQLKGGGWFAEGYSPGAKGKAEGKGETGSGSTKAPEPGSSDSKTKAAAAGAST